MGTFTADLTGLSGNPPADWTIQHNSGDWNFNGSGGADNSIRSNSAVGARGAASWDPPGNAGDYARVRALVSAVGLSSAPAVVARGSSGGDLGYRAHLQNTDELKLFRDGTEIASVAKTFGSSKRYIEIEVEEVGGSTWVRAKVWLEGASEPGSYDVEFEDTNAGRPTSGFVGVGGNSASSDWYEIEVQIGAAPTADTLAAEAVSSSQIDVTVTENDPDVSTRTLHQSTASGFTPSTSNRILTIGADPSTSPYNITSLFAGKTYRFLTIVGSTGSTDTAQSNEASATTLSSTAFDPPFPRVENITAISADLWIASTDAQGSTKVEWRTLSTAGSTIDRAIIGGSSDFRNILEGLSSTTIHLTDIRRWVDAVGWTDWSDELVWKTLSTAAADEAFGSFFTAPDWGKSVSGSNAKLLWTLEAGTTVSEIEISPSLGSTWNALSSPSSTGVTFSSTGFADDFYLARLTLGNGDVVNHAFVIANSIIVTEGGSTTGYTTWLNPDRELTIIEPFSADCLSCPVSGHIGYAGTDEGIDSASFGPVDPVALTFNRRATITAEMASWGFVRGPLGTGPRSAEYTTVAVNLVSNVTGGDNDLNQYLGIRAGVDWTTLSGAFGTDDENEVGVGWGRFRVGLGNPNVTGNGGEFHEFSIPVPVQMSWYWSSDPDELCMCIYRPMRVYLEVWRPDAATFPNRFAFEAFVDSPFPQDSGGEKRYQTTLSSTGVDITDGSTDLTLNCGHAGFLFQKIKGQYSGYNYRTVRHWTAWSDSTTCSTGVPAAPETVEVEEARSDFAITWLGRILVENSTGGFTDLANLAGKNWVTAVEWTADQDTPSGQASVDFIRETASTGNRLNLSPFVESSTLNTASTGDYAPLIQPGRELRIQLAAGIAPSTADLVLRFHGEIDKADIGDRPRIVGRDLYGKLLDTWIEDERKYGGSTAGSTAFPPLWEVIQSILDDNVSTADSVTLYSLNGTTASPINSTGDFPESWNVGEFDLKPDKSLGQAIKDLALQPGWDIRYLPHPDGGINPWRLTIYVPDRDKTDTDRTLTTSEYHAIRQLAVSRQHVRNAIKVQYLSSTSGSTSPVAKAVIAEDRGSEEKYGRRFARIGGDDAANIDNRNEAEQYAVSVLNDLAEPYALGEFTTLFDKGQDTKLLDLIKFKGNEHLWTEDQAWFVTAYRHRITAEGSNSDLELNGRLVGAFSSWLDKERTVSTLNVASTETQSAPAITFASGNVDEIGVCGSSPMTVLVSWTHDGASTMHYVRVLRSRAFGPWSVLSSTLGATSGSPYTDEWPDHTFSVLAEFAEVVRWRVELLRKADDVLLSNYTTQEQFISPQPCT